LSKYKISGKSSQVTDWADRSFKYLAITPMTLLLIVLSIYPIAVLLIMSFNNISFQNGAYVFRWVGLNNFFTAFTDKIFKESFLHTLIYVIISVGLETTIGFTLALWISRIKRGKIFFQTIFILPFLIPPVVNGTMWRLMYNTQYGLINLIFNSLGLPAQNWLSQPRVALLAIIVVTIWQWVGYNFLLMLAGLMAVPKSVLEAADLDGATGIKLCYKVIIPIMKPTIIVTLLFRIIQAFKGFDLFYILTGGGPGTATEIINTYIQKIFMTQQRLGYGSALSVLSIILIGVIAKVLQRGQDNVGGRE
jgi:multiple sugar transport system permease protein